MQTVICFLGFLFCAIMTLVCGIGVLFSDDQQKRAKGRGNMNDLLTNFGGGSFKNEVKSEASQVGYGCAKIVMQALFFVSLIFTIVLFRMTFNL